MKQKPWAGSSPCFHQKDTALMAMTASTERENTIVPVTPERHGPRRWRRFASYGFARTLQDVPIVLAKLEPAASALPLAFFQTRAASRTETRRAAAALADAGLLTRWTPSHGMTEADAAGYWSVDQAALGAVPENVLATLWQTGALRLAQSQLISRHHIGWIARVVAAGAGPPLARTAPPQPNAPSGDIACFLSALADAQAAEQDQPS